MTSFILSGGSYVEQTLADGEIGVVAADSLIRADSDYGILATGASGSGIVTINVFGQILATFSGAVRVQDANVRLFVGADAALTSATVNSVSYSAVVLEGGAFLTEIDNLGLIQSQSYGIYFNDVASTSVIELFNAGTILGNSAAIQLAAGYSASVVNTGRIVGDFYGLRASFVGETRIENSGEIRGSVGSLLTGFGDDIVVNRGALWGDVTVGSGLDVLDNRGGLLVGDANMGVGDDRVENRRGRIEGDALLGDGNDVLDNRKGSVDGTVYGEVGNDRLIASAAEDDIFDGGTGIDTIDYRYGAAVVVALDGSFDNAGAAINDAMSGVENVYGSRTGADKLRGSQASNVLNGEGGVDTLDGASGADWLIGGRGNDLLVGGVGNDTFVFQRLDQIGDVINDFGASASNDDRFQIAVAGFGAGLTAGVLAGVRFQSRADNVAQDANDRFVFRTTDSSLWFDADGSGLAAAVMVADLQAGATVTAADILLV